MLFEKQVIKIYRGFAYTRCDDRGSAYYFSAEDFPGLKREAYPFTASMGQRLQGYLYCYDSPVPGRLVVFDHGFFGGHRSYMKEIELLCRQGYLVFAYDHTGCMESEGADPNGMAQSLRDLNDCITVLKSDPRFACCDFSVIGHSWGGFAAMNIAALHPDISHVVVISGFVSVPLLIGSMFKGILKGYQKAILNLERASNPDYVGFDGVDTLSKTNAKVLLIYSADDALCKKDPHYDTLNAGLSQRENIDFLLVDHKGHNPNYTEDAVQYLGQFSVARTKLGRKKKLETDEARKAFVASFDWNRMTAQDEAVWKRIFNLLEK